MLEHYIQREIVYRLAHVSALRFSELKPDEIENKLFDYHLKKVISAGFVEKQADGLYALSQEGKRLGRKSLANPSLLIDRAYSLLVIAVRRKSDGAWLLYRRDAHPQIDKISIPQAQPQPGVDVERTAEYTLRNAGIKGNCAVHGSGFVTAYRGDDLESYIHFTLLKCDDAEADTLAAPFYWQEAPDFLAPDMLPSLAQIARMVDRPAGGYAAITYDIVD